MAYTLDIALALGSSQTGLTLKAQLVDTAGADVGSEVATGFSEIGVGNYLFHYAAFPDGHRGGIKFFTGAAPGTIKAFASVNPEEAENTDAKTSSRPSAAAIRSEIDANSTKLDVTVGSRMATFTVPASFAAANFVLLDAAVSADSAGTTTLLARIASALTINAGKVTVGVNDDKTGYGLADGAITAAKFTTGAINAAAIAADALTAIGAAVWAITTAGLTAAGTAGKLLVDNLNGSVLTVLNRLGGWTGSGINTVLGAMRALAAKAASLTPTDLSTGTTFDNTVDSQEATRDALSGFSDPLTNPVPGAYLEGSAGFVLGTYLDLPVSDVSPVLTVQPIYAQIATLAYGTDDKIIAQDSAPRWDITVVDARRVAVDLSGKTLRLVVATAVYPEREASFEYETGGDGITLGGVSNNVVSVQFDETDTAEPGEFHWWLWNIDDDIPLRKGRLTIEPSIKEVEVP